MIMTTSSPQPPNSKLLLIIMRWQVYRLARLTLKVVRFQHRRTHWWAAPLHQKQRNRSGLNNWLDCLASWYTPNFYLCIIEFVFSQRLSSILANEFYHFIKNNCEELSTQCTFGAIAQLTHFECLCWVTWGCFDRIGAMLAFASLLT